LGKVPPEEKFKDAELASSLAHQTSRFRIASRKRKIVGWSLKVFTIRHNTHTNTGGKISLTQNLAILEALQQWLHRPWTALEI